MARRITFTLNRLLDGSMDAQEPRRLSGSARHQTRKRSAIVFMGRSLGSISLATLPRAAQEPQGAAAGSQSTAAVAHSLSIFTRWAPGLRTLRSPGTRRRHRHRQRREACKLCCCSGRQGCQIAVAAMTMVVNVRCVKSKSRGSAVVLATAYWCMSCNKAAAAMTAC